MLLLRAAILFTAILLTAASADAGVGSRSGPLTRAEIVRRFQDYARARGFRIPHIAARISGKTRKSTVAEVTLGDRDVTVYARHRGGPGALRAASSREMADALAEAHVPVRRAGFGRRSRFAVAMISSELSGSTNSEIQIADFRRTRLAPLGRPRRGQSPEAVARDTYRLDGDSVVLELNRPVIAGEKGAALRVNAHNPDVLNLDPGRAEVSTNGWKWFSVGKVGLRSSGDVLSLEGGTGDKFVPPGTEFRYVRIMAPRRLDLISVEGIAGRR